MLNAVEFLMERKRMCESHSQHCYECELGKERCSYILKTKEDAEKAVVIVEKWSKEHPKKTRQSEFLKLYPNSTLSILDGHPNIDPCELDDTLHNESRCHNLCCSGCREQYWTEGVE